MVRNTDADVKQIFDTQRDTTPFIYSAAVLVDTYLASAGLSAALLTEIERWWAAHLCCLAEPRVIQNRMGETALTFEHGPMGQGLLSTRYGQQVVALDPTGLALEATTPVRRAMIRVD